MHCNYNGKKLLILAGADIHCKVVESAKEMGIYTVVTDYLKDSPAKLIADESLMYNIYDIDELTKWAKANSINGVIGFCCDPTSKPSQEIAKRLGLPVFGNDEQVVCLTKKGPFKQLCIDNGVDVIKTYTEEDLFCGNIEFPVLLKPTDSRGSRGITVCYDSSSLQEAFEKARNESSDGKVIIEKYMYSNQDLTISYIVKDGEPELISLGDRYSGRKEDNLDRQLVCTIQPSRFKEMYLKNVNSKVIKMIKNLGIKNGPVFMQGFVDGDTVRMYDPGIRFPGNEYDRIFKAATGLDTMKSIISYCVGGEILDYDGAYKDSFNLNGLCAIQYMINVGPGVIGTYEGLDIISHHPCVIDVRQKHNVGDVIKQTGDVKHRAGEISILVERNIVKMVEVIEYIQKHLKVISTDGKNMLISPFDGNLIVSGYTDNY